MFSISLFYIVCHIVCHSNNIVYYIFIYCKSLFVSKQNCFCNCLLYCFMSNNIVTTWKKKLEYCQFFLRTNNIVEYFWTIHNIVNNIVCPCWSLSRIVHNIVKGKPYCFVLFCHLVLFFVFRILFKLFQQNCSSTTKYFSNVHISSLFI